MEDTYRYKSDVKLGKILSDSSLKNKDLRRRTDLSPLLKTACHRYNYDDVGTFAAWFFMLDLKEQEEVVKYINMSPSYVLEIFHNRNVTITYEDEKELKEIYSGNAFRFIFNKLNVDFESPEAKSIMKLFTAKHKK